jgi:hypothetical protein
MNQQGAPDPYRLVELLKPTLIRASDISQGLRGSTRRRPSRWIDRHALGDAFDQGRRQRHDGFNLERIANNESAARPRDGPDRRLR